MLFRLANEIMVFILKQLRTWYLWRKMQNVKCENAKMQKHWVFCIFAQCTILYSGLKQVLILKSIMGFFGC